MKDFKTIDTDTGTAETESLNDQYCLQHEQVAIYS